MTNEARYTWTIRTEGDPDPDASYLEQDGFEDRLAAYRNDDFGFIGVYAECHDWQSGVTSRSAGIWGIESDSDEAYVREIGEQECSDLADVIGIAAPLPGFCPVK